MKEFSQYNLAPKDKQRLEDFMEVKGGIIVVKAPLQTDNFIEGARGVRIQREGLDATGGVISSDETSTTITGALRHTGNTVGFYNVTPVARPSAVANLTDSSGGTADNTVASVGATNSSDVSATINNNFADLSAKVNTILTALKNNGLMQ